MTGLQYTYIVLPLLIAFAVSLALGPVVIPMLRRLKAQQTERDDGPKSHLSKTGTPNMGGLMILGSLAVTCVVMYIVGYTEVIPVLFMTVGFGAVGFADDYIKVVKKRSMGLRAWQKLAMQIVIALVFAWYITNIHNIPLSMKVPFAAGVYLDFGLIGNILAFLFIAVATVNGTNLTDGVDGLSSSVTVVVAIFFTVTAFLQKSGTAPASAAMAGALMGFLYYNCHPAKVFMGDTGSLALGGFVVGMAYMLQLPLFIPIVGFIYLIETISVILQVGYFKMTHGKRLFRMAPIHHHYEMGGWSEEKVTTVFTIVTVMTSGIGLLAFWM